MLINNAVITGSFIVNGVDVTGITGSSAISSSYLALSSSYVITSASYAQSSASLSIRTSNLEATSSTLVSASSSFAADSASVSVRVTNLEATSSVVSSSFATTSGSIAGRVTIIEGQDATTGSNVFTGTQYISEASNAISFTSTASLYTDGGFRVAKDSFVSGTAYFNNITVYGTSSIEYITSSQVNIGSNIITVNTDTPAVRFGGLSVFDSGSTQLTGSLFWDSEKNHWIYSNPSGSSYNSAMLMNGPRNTGSLGNEQGTLSNYIMKGQGGDHITSSQIYTDDSSSYFYSNALYVTASGYVGIGTASPTYDLTLSKSVAAGNVVLNIENTSTTGAARLWFGNNASSTGARIQYFGATHAVRPNLFSIGTDAANDMIFETAGTERLRITSGGNLQVTGSATFSSSITATQSLILNGTNPNFDLQNSGTSRFRAELDGSNFTYLSTIGANNMILRTNGTARLTLDGSTGAATFSSNVNVNSYLSLGTGSGKFLAVGGAVTAGSSADMLMYNTGGDLIFWTTGAVGMIVKATSGNVGIGTSSPLNKLHVEGSSGIRVSDSSGATYRGISFGATPADAVEYAYIKYQPNSGQLIFFGSPSGFGGNTIFQNNASTWLSVNSSNAISFTGAAAFSSTVTLSRPSSGATLLQLLGTDAYGDTSTINLCSGRSYIKSTILVTANGDTDMAFGTQSGGVIAERLKIGSDGRLSLKRGGGTVNFDVFLSGGGDNFCDVDGQVFRTKAFLPIADNTYAIGSSGSRWTAVWAVNGSIQTSDKRQKKNIIKSDLGIDFVNKLNPVKYNWIDGDAKIHYGLIAQEVESLNIDNFGALYIEDDKYGLNYSEFIAPMIKAIQELSAKVDAQAAEINELKNR